MNNLFLQLLIYGISIGGIYALLALGYSMVYGVLRMVNFAHGDFFMVASFCLVYAFSHSVHMIAALLLSIISCILLGVLAERIAYRPLYHSSGNDTMITAVSLSLFLQNCVQTIFGAEPILLPPFLPEKHVITITLFTTVFCTVLLLLWLYQTKTGKAVRAITDDKEAAALCGIPVFKMIAFVFSIGSGLAAIAAFLYNAIYPAAFPLMGAVPGLKAYTAAVLGGIGSFTGAILGGLCIGILECLLKGYLEPLTHGMITAAFADGIVYLLLLLILLFRPHGILSPKRSEKA